MSKNKQIQTGKSGHNIEFINIPGNDPSLLELYAAEKKLTKTLADSYIKAKNNTKSGFYNKLLKKLEKLKSGEITLDQYIAEVKEKIKKYA